MFFLLIIRFSKTESAHITTIFISHIIDVLLRDFLLTVLETVSVDYYALLYHRSESLKAQQFDSAQPIQHGSIKKKIIKTTLKKRTVSIKGERGAELLPGICRFVFLTPGTRELL